MKKILANIRDSKGFVSIEVVLIAGSIIILAGVVLFYFNGKASEVTRGAGKQLMDANDIMNGDTEPQQTP